MIVTYDFCIKSVLGYLEYNGSQNLTNLFRVSQEGEEVVGYLGQ